MMHSASQARSVTNGCSAWRQCRPGFSLLEVILFFGILGIIIGTVMATSIATEETRIRQKSIAEVEQRSAQLIETMTTAIHRAEAVLVPASNQTGSILALQMSLNAEFPTMFAKTASGGLLLIQKTTVESLISPTITVSNLQFRNVNGTNVTFSFDIATKIPLVKPVTYSRHLESTATLFPDDQSQSGGCGSCPAPACVNHLEQWYDCESDACTLSTSSFAC